MNIDDIYEKRRKALQKLIDKHGTVAEYARTHGFDENRIRHLLQKRRNFGEKAARQMEVKCNLPPFYFDVEGSDTVSRIISLLPLVTDPRDQDKVLRIVDLFARQAEDCQPDDPPL